MKSDNGSDEHKFKECVPETDVEFSKADQRVEIIVGDNLEHQMQNLRTKSTKIEYRIGSAPTKTVKM